MKTKRDPYLDGLSNRIVLNTNAKTFAEIPVKKFKQKVYKHQCVEDVIDRQSRFPRFNRCEFDGRVKRNGKWYCHVHDPIKVLERKQKRDQKFKKEFEKTMQRHEDQSVGAWLRKQRPKLFKQFIREIKAQKP